MKIRKSPNQQCILLDTKRSRISAVLILILSLLVLLSSVLGITDRSIYREVHLAGTIAESLISGSIAQDIVFVPLSIVSVFLSLLFFYRQGYKSFISLLGLSWCFFYGYGLYVIQGQYTYIYLVYMAIFGLSLYSMIFGAVSFKLPEVAKTKLSRSLRVGISIYFILTLSVLVPGWLLRIIPDISRHIPGNTYAVFILDLCMVFPAFAIITYQLLRNRAVGNILSGIALLKGFTLCLSWSFSELAAPLFGKPMHYDMAVISTALTVFGLVLFIPYIINLKTEV